MSIEELCAHCGGTGIADNVCPLCKGKGRVHDDRLAYPLSCEEWADA